MGCGKKEVMRNKRRRQCEKGESLKAVMECHMESHVRCESLKRNIWKL